MEVKKGITCDPGFLILASELVLLDGEGVLPWATLAAAVHELGHYAAVRLQGGSVRGLHLTISGGEMPLDQRHPLTYAGELIAILAGPAANLLLALAALRLGSGREEGWLLAGLSLCLGWFNLLPVWPLDGGRALMLILTGFLPHDTVAAGVRVCSLALGFGLLTGGLSLLVRGGGATLALMGGWLLACQFRGRKVGK